MIPLSDRQALERDRAPGPGPEADDGLPLDRPQGPPPALSRRGSTRRWRKTVFGLLATVALAAAAAWWVMRDETNSEPKYVTQPVVVGNIEDTVSALGSLQPLQYVDVGTQVSGQLQKIYVDYGDTVKKGQLLAEIDPTVYQAKVGTDEAQLVNLRAQVAEKQAQKTLAEQQFQRQKELLAAHATSQDSYDSAAATLKVTTAQIDQLQAQIKETESQLSGDQANLGYTKIYAPMSGTVVNVVARQGQTLNANQTAPVILRIADLDTMTVWTQVSEADAPKLRIGMPAYFTTLGEPDHRRYGKLRQILPTPEVVNNVVLYDSLFDVPNPDHDLLPQMSAQVFFVVAEAKHVPIVPMAALRPVPHAARPDQYTAEVLVNGKPVQRTLTVGVTNRLSAEVKSGLEPGDEVILNASAGEARSDSQVPSAARRPRL
jgi:macrolide-specific efflux system membrane fusion protein